MPTKIEKDDLTGTETTGHEWDGIKELNTPLPKWWLYVFYASIVVAVVYVILYPAIPLVNTYTPGLLGYSQRQALDASLQRAEARQSTYLSDLRDVSYEQIVQDQELLTFALAGGEAAFADNCAACHGLGGAGQKGGFPSLADDAWLWGGTFDAIHETLLYGIRSEHEMTRLSQMPTFGGEAGFLTREEIRDVAAYVLSLSGRAEDGEAAARGEATFMDQCSFCHGENGTGMQEVGAPNLTDAIWLYGGERSDVVAQVTQPRHGIMPAWGERLDADTIRMLTVYVHSLGGGQ